MQMCIIWPPLLLCLWPFWILKERDKKHHPGKTYEAQRNILLQYCSWITTFLALGFHMLFPPNSTFWEKPCRGCKNPRLTRILGQLFPPLNTPCYSIFLLSSWEQSINQLPQKSIKGTKSRSTSFKVRYLQVKQGRYEHVIQTSLSSLLGVNKPKLNKTSLKCFESIVKVQKFDFFQFHQMV